MTRRLCGEPLRFYEWPGGPAVLDGLTCARRAGHKSPRHRSAPAMEAARRKAADQPPTGSPVVAAAIRQHRREARMSQQALAAAVGVTGVCVSLWERAQRSPSPESWVQLELTLGPLGIVREAPEAATRDGQEQAA